MTKRRRRKRGKLTADEEKAKVEAFLRATPKKPLTPAYARGAHSGPTVKPRARTRNKE